MGCLHVAYEDILNIEIWFVRYNHDISHSVSSELLAYHGKAKLMGDIADVTLIYIRTTY